MPHFSLHSSLLLSSLNLFDSSFFPLRSSLSSVNVYVIFSPEKCTGYLGKGYICNVNKIYSGKQRIKLAKTETVRKPISRNKTTYKTNLVNKLFTKLIIGISATASLSAAAETVKWNFTSVPAAMLSTAQTHLFIFRKPTEYCFWRWQERVWMKPWKWLWNKNIASLRL